MKVLQRLHIQGVEVEYRSDYEEKVNAFMNYTFLDAQDEDDHKMQLATKHKGNLA